ncbi:unnamed protein product (macronuclear) [Paramecium tetraurelia]|uniref:Uncharacterized protein n=1 Tax=Paramecium tetraurelia TaxID=5888 RepID=A0E5Y3_PARTE|nr:uncharacterized protein GSPATT00003563001 [Paramecium tetraurelia]CAK90700.1 unnamed protein product [Paramecium tetraurelia]|eukprot:XP_001458097.1 hypothetical protein (macronuclear) [Paramecium tetraurelia strain d4-2]
MKYVYLELRYLKFIYKSQQLSFNFYFKYFLKIKVEFIPDISQYKRELHFVILSAFYYIKLMRNNNKFDNIGEIIKEESF